jgi:hypothetical protein
MKKHIVNLDDTPLPMVATSSAGGIYILSRAFVGS